MKSRAIGPDAGATLEAWLREAPFDLVMSSGFFGFFAHAGVLSVLDERGLKPAHVCGSSAGALISGLYAGGMRVDAIRDELFRLKREDFWDPFPGLGLLRGRLFRERLGVLVDDRSIEDCTVGFSASVFDLLTRETMTVRRGDLATAIHASCAFPGLFQPVSLHGRPCLDGGIADRPGFVSARRNQRTLFHHLSSKSPWRRKGSPALAIPKRANTTTLVIDEMPRLGPFSLEVGPTAFAHARAWTERALQQPIQSVS